MTNQQARADPFDLKRFVDAQQPVYATALAELQQGRKRTHWMWFVFPQVDGLGVSSMAQHYAIKSAAEASAYLDHPVLGLRLFECTETVLGHSRRSAHDILGSPDDLKFCSSMTLFAKVSDSPVFPAALERFFDSKPDQKTLAILATWRSSR